MASGVVWLDWDDVEDAAGYELMYRSAHGWVLLADDEAAGGVVVAFEGSGARVVGLPADVSEHWFAVRARNVQGVSAWSESVGVAVPAYAQTDRSGAAVFDPFTAPTRSGIDLERLREAVATITPGRADCSMTPALDVAGISVVGPPADLNDADAELTVAEVVRIAGGCLVVEYVELAGRTVNEVRELLEAEPSVHAVGAPARGLSLEHDDTAHAKHSGDHHDDGGGEQWHLPQDAIRDLWNGWQPSVPVTVAVLDTGVTSTHPDLSGRVVTGGLDACHRRDPDGHGTHVAGIVAADDGDGYVAGVAPDAEILSVRVLERAACEPSITATAAVVAAVNAGARVINMSFKWPLCERDTGTVGGLPVEAVEECDPDMYDPGDADDSFELALRAGSMLGVVAVTSVGNDGQDSDTTGPINQRNGPALYPDVISVAAINRDGRPYSHSTANDLVDIAAPGGAILSTVPLLTCDPPEDTNGNGKDERGPLGCGTDTSPAECAAGTPLREFSEAPSQACAHYVGHKWGTSMASPFVAGVVAHMLNRHPDAKVGDVRLALVRSARRDLDIDFPNHSYGFGIVDPVEAVARLGEIVAGVEATDAGGFAAVAAGGRFSCGLRSSGRMRCWGRSGAVSNTPGLAFVEVSAPTGPADHACGINMSSLQPGGQSYGTALCWSATGAGVPRVVQGALDQVVTGFAASCGLRPDGSVVCWDNGTGESRYQSDIDGETFVEISGGWLHFCGRRTDNSVACWGSTNAHGQTDVPAGVKFLTVDVGGSHTCGVTVAGAIRCWGRSSATAGAPAATQTGFLALDAGHSHTCAIRQAGPGPLFNAYGGPVLCWGDNTFDQTAAPATSLTQVSAGWRHSCGRRPDATVVCWGSDSSGQAPQARLASLSLTLAGTNLIAFNPDVTDYSIVAEPGQVDLAYTVADHETSGPSTEAFPRDANTDPTDPMSAGHQVVLADGAVIEVRVDSLLGFGESRTYRIRVAEPPRLTSLSVIPMGTGPHCTPACAPLELDPVFDSGVFDYSVVAPADLSRVTVYPSAVGGRAVVSPADADTGVSGRQVVLSTDRDFTAVAAGGLHSCGVKTDASVACWGDNRDGQTDAPAGSFSSVAAGGGHSCGVRTDASVVCWGDNYQGRTDAPAGSFSSVAAGRVHSCGVKSDASVVCWGDNGDGQSDAPAGSFSAVAAGYYHTCGVKADASVVCWGDNDDGQSDAPAGSFSAVSAGWRHACGVKSDASVVCWGDNDDGQSDAPEGSFSAVAASGGLSCGVKTDASVVCWGDNDSKRARPPVGSFSAIAAGELYLCGVRTDASVVCWGYPDFGQADAPSGSFSAIAAGYSFSCGINSDSTVSCWGSNYAGQAEPPEGSFSAIAAGGNHSCGIKTDSSVVCWGHSLFGATNAPEGSFIAVAAANWRSCGIKTDSSVVCWGSNSWGQTDTPEGSFTAVAASSWNSCGIKADASVVCWGRNASGLSDPPAGSFTAIAADESHMCGIKADASVVCWGSNQQGQTEAPEGSFTAVAAGNYHSCGVKTDASLVCWGDNRYGQTDTPQGSFTAVTANDFHSCGIKTDNSAVCWGTRWAALEPAASVAVDVEVTSRADPAVSTRYTINVTRPQPMVERATRPASSRDARSGAATPRSASDADPPCDDWRGCYGLHDGLAPECYLELPECESLTSESTDTDSNGADPDKGAGTRRAVPHDAAAPQVSSSQGTVPPCPSPTGGTTGVEVPDAVLRAAINRHLDKAPDAAVTAVEMAELTALELPPDADDARVVSLSGLEHASNLTSLDLYGHAITDISALSCLGSLTTLELGANDIADISALSGLSGLTTLGLSGNEITDVSALSGLSSLTALDVSHNNIASVAPLAGIGSLRSLNAAGNEITSLSALSALTALEALHAYDNQITDIAALSGLTNLTILYLDHNQITSSAALSALTSLSVLGLGDNQIRDISALGALTGLEVLYLFDNDITGGGALSGLNSLTTLWIDGNDLNSPYGWALAGGLGYLDARHNLIADIAPLDNLAAPGGTVHSEPQRVATVQVNDTSLRAALLAALGKTTGGTLSPAEIATIERLERVGPQSDPSPISDLSGLEHATSLTDLRLRNNAIASIEPIASLDSLERLDLQANRFTDLEQLEGLTSLRWLNLLQNNIASIDALPTLANLEMLFLDFNNITDITPLTGHHNLTRLGLVGNNITDITALAQLTNLDWVMISANNITDITALASLERLHYLRLTNNNISDLTPLSGLTRLTNLHLYRNNITDLEPLRGLTNLEFLDLRDNNITSLEPLRGLTGLEDLYIGDNHVTDFAPLDGIAGLTIHGRDDQTPTS